MFGRDFFKIFGFVIRLIRLIAECFGDDDDKASVNESKARSANHDPNEAC